MCSTLALSESQLINPTWEVLTQSDASQVWPIKISSIKNRKEKFLDWQVRKRKKGIMFHPFTRTNNTCMYGSVTIIRATKKMRPA
jgi:hypothetical protein